MTTCDDCKDEIALTDVAGHYDAKCAKCRKDAERHILESGDNE